jgi:hypothetical protein
LIKIYPGKQKIVQGVSIIMNSNPYLMKQYLPEVMKFQFEILKNTTTIQQKRETFNSLFTIIKAISNQSDVSSY